MVIGLIASYLLGSIPTAYLVGKMARGIDIRQHGSGNVGATNVFREVGINWGVGVLMIDIVKGYAASAWLPLLFGLDGFNTRLFYGLAAIAGHTWTVWLKFKGGKGVATSLGVALALVPKAAVAALLVFAVVFALSRYVSLGSLSAAGAFPALVIVFYRRADFFSSIFLISLGLAFFIFYNHRENIKRLREGTEKRLL